MLGSLLAYITDPERKDFQPMNSNFGLMPPIDVSVRGKEKKQLMAERALKDLEDWLTVVGEEPEAFVPNDFSVIPAKAGIQ